MNFKIIATDFDGTLCENKWPEIGEPNYEVINYLKKERDAGAKTILWTCRTYDKLTNAINWCAEQGLVFDAVNKNVREAIEKFGEDTRKVFANEYIDDRMYNRFKLPFVKNELRAFVDMISELPTCNSCNRASCEYKPQWGSSIRYNCPLYVKGEGHETVIKGNQ